MISISQYSYETDKEIITTTLYEQFEDWGK